MAEPQKLSIVIPNGIERLHLFRAPANFFMTGAITISGAAGVNLANTPARKGFGLSLMKHSADDPRAPLETIGKTDESGWEVGRPKEFEIDRAVAFLEAGQWAVLQIAGNGASPKDLVIDIDYVFGR